MRLTLKFIFVLLFSITFSSCSKNGDGPSGKPTQGVEPSELSGKPGDCKEFIASLPNDYFHDWLTVPEIPNDNSSPPIKVFYYGPKMLNQNLVLFYNGGPGSDSHGSVSLFEPPIKQYGLQKNISIIYMDQRGTGCSSAYPHEKTNEDILRARWYGSTGIVYDSEALRQKLVGDKKWRVFGQSYGGFIVHRYVSLFPQSIEAAYSHANTLNDDPQERLYNRIFSQYRVFNMYLLEHPEDKEKFEALKKYLTVQKCFETKYVGPVCGHDVLSEMVALVRFSNRWPRLHTTIGAIVIKKDLSLVTDDEQIKKFITDYVDYDEAETGYTLSVIGYYDRNTLPTNFEYCSLIYKKLSSFNIGEDQILMNECMPAIQTQRTSNRLQKIKEVLNFANDHLSINKFKSGLLQMSSKAFFLYSGEKDTFVPKEMFTEELNAVGTLLNYTHFQNSGHEGFRSEKQVWDDLVKVF